LLIELKVGRYGFERVESSVETIVETSVETGVETSVETSVEDSADISAESSIDTIIESAWIQHLRLYYDESLSTVRGTRQRV
jgi:hypothetical protein